MKTVKLKISELEGAGLDWSVAKVCGIRVQNFRTGGDYIEMVDYESTREGGPPVFCPSRKWADGGPLIESHGVWTFGPTKDRAYWMAAIAKSAPIEAIGNTPLIAAMRAIVASKTSGDTVTVPAELAGGAA